MILDLFAGPGGWDLGAMIVLGKLPVGIELDDAACATREAAGLPTIQGDVAELDPIAAVEALRIEGLIASPPCQAFSMAGNGKGREAMDLYARFVRAWRHHGIEPDVEDLDEACGDPRAHLVLEPLRWALALRPEWIACEQVEPVLPIWEEIAGALMDQGYGTWTGILSAEQYGVPQTRRRAFLLARLHGEVRPPAPTHARYVSPRRAAPQEESLFDAPDPERITLPEDRHLLPWVSMAEALGWGMTAAPTTTMVTVRGGGAETSVLDGGAHSREVYARAREAGEWYERRPATTLAGSNPGIVNPEGGGKDVPTSSRGYIPWTDGSDVEVYTERGAGMIERHGERPARKGNEPAPTLTAGGSRWSGGPRWALRQNAQGKATEREADEPAPTIMGGNSYNERVWLDTHRDQRDDGETHQERPLEEPAPTVTGAKQQVASWEWRTMTPEQRPSTTVNGDPRISEPGHHDADSPGSQQHRAIRVQLEEALVLQSFPPDYPVQGNKGKRFEQVGNAVPPLLAAAVLRAVALPE